jgi:hypothetical protein
MSLRASHEEYICWSTMFCSIRPLRLRAQVAQTLPLRAPEAKRHANIAGHPASTSRSGSRCHCRCQRPNSTEKFADS